MKKFTFCFLLFFLNFSNSMSEGKIYYLDIDFILNNSDAGKLVIKKLNDVNSKNIIDLKKKESELKDQENEINKLKNIISENELKNKINDLKKKIKLYRDEKNKKTEEFNQLRNKDLALFFKKITPYIEEFMKKNSIEILLDKKNVFIANSKYDITKLLIEYINSKK